MERVVECLMELSLRVYTETMGREEIEVVFPRAVYYRLWAHFEKIRLTVLDPAAPPRDCPADCFLLAAPGGHILVKAKATVL